MKYLVLLMADGDEKPPAEMSETEMAELMAKFGEFDQVCAATEGVQILGGEALAEGDSATTVRQRGGREVTDGPYAEATEGLGGFYLLEAPDLDAVLEVIKALPAYDMQVNPVVEF